MFGDAGHAYVKLAEMPGVNRRSELDKAHTNYDSAYLATQNPSRLCWALKDRGAGRPRGRVQRRGPGELLAGHRRR
jgi:hypothetical protein